MCWAASAVETWGTTIPLAPQSSTRPIRPGSFWWMRTIQAIPHRSALWDGWAMSWKPGVPCSVSIHTPSSPTGPR